MKQKKTKADLLVELEQAKKRIAELEASDTGKRVEEERWQFALEGAAEGVWDWDIQNNRVFFSQCWKSMLGYREDEIGDTLDEWASRVHPDDLAGVLEKVNAHLAGETPFYSSEYRIHCKDGNYKWILGRGKVAAWTADHQPLRFIGTHKDITKRKQAEDKLRESERRLTTLLSNLLGFAYRCQNDRNWTMEYVSSECQSITGYRPDDLIGNRTLAYNDLIHPADREQVWENIQKALTEQAPYRIEYRIITQAGIEKWVWEQGRGIFEDGKLKAIEGFITDVTDRKHAEQALLASEEKYRNLSMELEERVQQRTTEIEAIRQRLELATQVASLGVWDWNIRSGQLFWDDQVYAVYGVSKDAFVVSLEAFLSIVYPEDVPNLIKFTQEAIAGMSSGQIEYRVLRNDNTLGYVKAHGAILFDMEGQPEHVIGVVQDVTQDRLAENALRESKAMLEMINEELESFSYSVSHDLRAPLRRIDNWAAILAEEHNTTLDEQGQEYLKRVRSEVQSMNQLISDLLGLARVTRLEMHMRPVSLSDLAQRITDRLRSDAPERKAEVIIQPGISVIGDEHLLAIAMTNLLDNAWKYTGRRENTHIEFGMKNTPQGTVYYVRDNGVGFNMEYANKLFGAFQRLHSISEFPGTGIGLATAQRIIRRHNGNIWAEARIDAGATFYFTIQTATG